MRAKILDPNRLSQRRRALTVHRFECAAGSAEAAAVATTIKSSTAVYLFNTSHRSSDLMVANVSKNGKDIGHFFAFLAALARTVHTTAKAAPGGESPMRRKHMAAKKSGKRLKKSKKMPSTKTLSAYIKLR